VVTVLVIDRLLSQARGSLLACRPCHWAMESHQIAKDHAYLLPDDRKLGEDYYQANVTVVGRQLAKGGVRLAKLLNDALAKK
jgi:hypothetical protein